MQDVCGCTHLHFLLPENSLVAVVAVLSMVMGAFFGVLIQRAGRVLKRLHRSIIAATMFTNFVRPVV